jgi:hypothetical protein
MAAPSELRWFKSSYSGGSGTECVEYAYADDGMLIRDSKRLGGLAVHFRRETWRMFLQALAQDV